MKNDDKTREQLLKKIELLKDKIANLEKSETERLSAEQAGKQTEEQLRQIKDQMQISIDNMPNAYILWDQDLHVVKWNKAAEKIFGYTKEEMLGKNPVDYIVPKPVRHLVKDVLRKLEIGEVADYSEKDNNIRKDGKLISCQWFNTPLADKNGNVFGILTLAQDITERLQAEEALKESKAYIENIITSTTDTILVINPDACIERVNPAALACLGFTEDELLGIPIGKLFGEEEVFNKQILSLVEGKLQALYDRDPEDFWSLLKTGPLGVAVVDSKQKIMTANKKIKSIFGYTKDELSGRSIHILLPPDIREVHEQHSAKFMDSPKPRFMGQDRILKAQKKDGTTFNVDIGLMPLQINNETCVVSVVRDLASTGQWEFIRHTRFGRLFAEEVFWNEDRTFVAKDGRKIPVLMSGTVMRDDSGDIQGAVLVAKDITERKRVEAALRESKERFQQIVERSSDVFYLQNINTVKFEYMSPKVMDILGRTPEEMYSMDFEEQANQIHPDDLPNLIDFSKDLVEADNKGIGSIEREFRIMHKSGEYKWVRGSYNLIRDANGEPEFIVGGLQDITERKQGEEEIHLLLTMFKAINEAEDFNSALEITLRKVCETTKWDYGEAWIPRSDGTELEYCPAWYCSTESLEEFRKLSQEYTFTPGAGLPGRVWSSKHPEWIPDVSAETKTFFVRSKNAREIGLKAALGVPIIIENEVLAVLSFFMYEHRQKEKHLVELVSAVATQLGSVIQRKQSEEALIESEEKFRGVVNQSNDGIYVLQKDRFVLINSIFTEITGYYLEELSAPDFSYMQLVAEAGKKVLEEREFLRHEGEEPPSHFIFKGLKKDGREIDLDVSVTSIEWEGAPAVLGIVRDVTRRIEHRKKLEEALQSAKQANSVKSLFLANMSHEIRTPLNTILGFTDLLEISTGHIVGEEEKTFFNTIKNSGQRLMHTVHEILDISQIEAGTYASKAEQIDLVKLVEELVQECQLMANEKGLKLENKSDLNSAFIQADQHGISLAIRNIIDNAVKYTEQGKITVSLRQKSKKYILTIRDTGISIAEDYLDSMFEAFTQESEGYTKKFQGIGLGLAIAKHHLDLNDVGIEVDSTKDVGTTMTLTFKAVINSLPKKRIKEETKILSTTESIEKLLVLLVEDDPGSQKLTEFFLKGTHDVCFAVSVNEAKQQLKKCPVDLILLDLSLVGEEDGLDLVRWMRKTKTWRKTPVIANTAHALTKDRDNCLAAGCNDYLPKPIKREKLLEKMSEYV